MKNLQFGKAKLETYGEEKFTQKLNKKGKEIKKFLKSEKVKKFKERFLSGLKKIGSNYEKIANSPFAENIRNQSLVNTRKEPERPQFRRSYGENPNYNQSYFDRVRKSR